LIDTNEDQIKVKTHTFSILYALFYIGAIALPKLSAFALLSVLFLFIFSDFKTQKTNYQFNSLENLIILLTGLLFINYLFGLNIQIDAVNLEILKNKIHKLDNASRWLLLTPILFISRHSLIDWRFISYGLIVGSFFAFIHVIYQFYFQGIPRPYGFQNNPIIFAEILVFVDLALWMISYYSMKLGMKYLSVFSFIAGLLAFYSSLLAASRGAWLAYLVVFFIFIVFFLFKKKRLKKLINKQNLIRVIVMLMLVVFVSKSDQFQSMQFRTASSFTAAIDGDAQKASGNRAHYFLESFETIKDYPLGIGTDNFSSLNIYVKPNGTGGTIANHAHNVFLNTLVENGVQGLTIFLLLFIVLTIYFLRECKSKSVSSKVYAYMGLILIFCYSLFGISQDVFSHNSTLIFFIFTIYFLIGQINRQKYMTLNHADN